MTEMEAFALVLALEDRPQDVYDTPLGRIDFAPAYAVAGCAMVGWLDDAESAEDVMAGLHHFDSCLNAGVFTKEEFCEEVAGVVNRWMAHVNDLMMAGEIVV